MQPFKVDRTNMKHYIGTLDIFFDEHCTQNLVLINAANDAAARNLLRKHAMDWVGDAAEQEDPDDEHFSSVDTMAAARITALQETTPAVYAGLKDLVEVIGDPSVGSLVDEEDDERVKTLSRRIGSQLEKLAAPVPHGKMLKAVSASLGETDWQVLLNKARQATSAQDLSAFEGLELWLMSGREYGDQDDSATIVWAADMEQAKKKFVTETLDLSEEDLKHDSDNNPLYFMCTMDKLGVVKNGSLELLSMYLPS